ncbi:MAG: hypothetical protein HY010_08765 [Acidobacteria bacterium]|nr:hypothetical protein [Acidobacteriota bacterium]
MPPRNVPTAPAPPIGGPSLLGLDQTELRQSGNVDDFRDRAFSGLASYGSPEESKSGGKQILLTVVLLAALAGAGWWTYKNYINVTDGRKPVAAVPSSQAAANNPPEDPAPKPAEKSAAKEAPPAAVPEPTPETTSAAPAAKPVEDPAPPEAKQAVEPESNNVQKAQTPVPTPARHEVSATRIPAPKPAPAVDTGDALFRRGEAYLYGRNGTEDCGNALKFLKMASDKQHAKARSTMGTMYATGHCVSRDLPSSYRWFALALQADPNNSILEKDLSAVWNQMTPPERQLATRR